MKGLAKVRPDGSRSACERELRFRDALHVTTTIRFGWLDRLRVLLFGVAHHRVVVETENVIGRQVVVEDVCWVPNPLRFRRAELASEAGYAPVGEGRRDDG